MFYYTASKKVIRSMFVEKTGAWWNKEFFKRMEILKQFHLPQDYSMTVLMNGPFQGTKFYSQQKVKEIPVNGVMFPAEMFDMKEI